jgi:hypothetical protein
MVTLLGEKLETTQQRLAAARQELCTGDQQRVLREAELEDKLRVERVVSSTVPLQIQVTPPLLQGAHWPVSGGPIFSTGLRDMLRHMQGAWLFLLPPASALQACPPESALENLPSRVCPPESALENPPSRIRSPESALQNPDGCCTRSALLHACRSSGCAAQQLSSWRWTRGCVLGHRMASSCVALLLQLMRAVHGRGCRQPWMYGAQQHAMAVPGLRWNLSCNLPPSYPGTCSSLYFWQARLLSAWAVQDVPLCSCNHCLSAMSL